LSEDTKQQAIYFDDDLKGEIREYNKRFEKKTGIRLSVNGFVLSAIKEKLEREEKGEN
jgi:pyruvate/2-oxoglutarate dehydrogenase complex dihydrolipoamide acyltransferase (E2) component